MSVNPLGLPVLEIGRDVNGQFRPGNKGGPGNPFARKVASLRKALIDSVSEQDIKDITALLKLQALRGDRASIRLLLQYCVGRPEPVKDPDRMDIDEWDRLEQLSVSEEAFEQTTNSFPADLASHRAETHWPCNAQEGPLEQDIRSIHTRMHAAGQHPLEPNPLPNAAQEEPDTPANQTSEPNPPAPTEIGSRPTDERRTPSGGSQKASRSTAQPPSPNGENEEEQLRTIEILRRAWKPTTGNQQPTTG